MKREAEWDEEHDRSVQESNFNWLCALLNPYRKAFAARVYVQALSLYHQYNIFPISVLNCNWSVKISRIYNIHESYTDEIHFHICFEGLQVIASKAVSSESGKSRKRPGEPGKNETKSEKRKCLW